LPATYWVRHIISCITQFNAPEDGQNYCCIQLGFFFTIVANDARSNIKFLIADCHSTSTPSTRYNKLPSHVIFSIRQRSFSTYLSRFTYEIIFLCRRADVIITQATFCFGKAEAKQSKSPEILHKSHPRRTRRSSLLSSPHPPHPPRPAEGQP